MNRDPGACARLAKQQVTAQARNSGAIQGLIGEPPVTRGVAARPGGLDELGGEALRPPVDGHMIDGDAALGEQFLNVAVGQAVAQVPADCDRDHLPRDRKPANTEDELDDVTAPVSRPP